MEENSSIPNPSPACAESLLKFRRCWKTTLFKCIRDSKEECHTTLQALKNDLVKDRVFEDHAVFAAYYQLGKFRQTFNGREIQSTRVYAVLDELEYLGSLVLRDFFIGPTGLHAAAAEYLNEEGTFRWPDLVNAVRFIWSLRVVSRIATASETGIPQQVKPDVPIGSRANVISLLFATEDDSVVAYFHAAKEYYKDMNVAGDLEFLCGENGVKNYDTNLIAPDSVEFVEAGIKAIESCGFTMRDEPACASATELESKPSTKTLDLKLKISEVFVLSDRVKNLFKSRGSDYDLEVFLQKTKLDQASPDDYIMWANFFFEGGRTNQHIADSMESHDIFQLLDQIRRQSRTIVVSVLDKEKNVEFGYIKLDNLKEESICLLHKLHKQLAPLDAANHMRYNPDKYQSFVLKDYGSVYEVNIDAKDKVNTAFPATFESNPVVKRCWGSDTHYCDVLESLKALDMRIVNTLETTTWFKNRSKLVERLPLLTESLCRALDQPYERPVHDSSAFTVTPLTSPDKNTESPRTLLYKGEPEKIPVSIVLATTTETAFLAVRRNMKPLPIADSVLEVVVGKQIFWVGVCGVYISALFKYELVGVQQRASMFLSEAFRVWRGAKAVISVGVGCGLPPQQPAATPQQHGDILLAKNVYMETNVPFIPVRCVAPEHGSLFSCFVRARQTWKSNGSKIHDGFLVSQCALKNIDAKLAIGIEEGDSTVYDAANENRADWIVVKGISRIGSYEELSTSPWEELAATNAVSLVIHCLSDMSEGLLSTIGCIPFTSPLVKHSLTFIRSEVPFMSREARKLAELIRANLVEAGLNLDFMTDTSSDIVCAVFGLPLHDIREDFPRRLWKLCVSYCDLLSQYYESLLSMDSEDTAVSALETTFYDSSLHLLATALFCLYAHVQRHSWNGQHIWNDAVLRNCRNCKCFLSHRGRYGDKDVIESIAHRLHLEKNEVFFDDISMGNGVSNEQQMKIAALYSRMVAVNLSPIFPTSRWPLLEYCIGTARFQNYTYRLVEKPQNFEHDAPDIEFRLFPMIFLDERNVDHTKALPPWVFRNGERRVESWGRVIFDLLPFPFGECASGKFFTEKYICENAAEMTKAIESILQLQTTATGRVLLPTSS